ncbi:MAG: hypothetical protein PUE08_03555 [Eubacteriales bacterium]|nr:hypothetical protein [Eubacteriales bacterium]
MTTDNETAKSSITADECDEISKLLSDCLYSLYCPRGKFYPKKDYGSLIRLCQSENEMYLLAYARQALSAFDGVYVKSVAVEKGNFVFTLLINEQERTVTLTYEADI